MANENLNYLKVFAAAFVAHLIRRTRDLRLAQTASSLAFLTMLAIVPMASMGVWLLTLFPSFSKLRDAFEQAVLGQFLLPTIAAPVIKYINQFTAQAGKLSIASLLGFTVTGLIALATIEKTFSLIWSEQGPDGPLNHGRRRPLFRRLGFYWLLLVAGPLFIGLVLFLAVKLGTPMVDWLVDWLVNTRGEKLQIKSGIGSFWTLSLTAVCLTALYRWLPSADVKWRDAAVGAVFAALMLQVLKWSLVWYLKAFPTFTTVYGALSILPIMLVWLNGLWLCVLLGALASNALGATQQRLLNQSNSVTAVNYLSNSVAQSTRHRGAQPSTRGQLDR